MKVADGSHLRQDNIEKCNKCCSPSCICSACFAERAHSGEERYVDRLERSDSYWLESGTCRVEAHPAILTVRPLAIRVNDDVV